LPTLAKTTRNGHEQPARYAEFRVITRTFFPGCAVLTMVLAGAFAGATPTNATQAGAARADATPADTAALWQSLVASGVRAASARDFAGSEELLLKALRVAGTFPPGDPRTGTTSNTLGLVYKEEKKYSEAEKTFGQALGILQKAYGPDSLDVGNVNFNIASVLLSEGRYEESLPYIEKSRTVYDRILGPESLKSASTLCMVGVAYRNLKKFDEAEAPLKQCADMREASGGMQNADLADALYNLALVYEHQGKYALADPRLKLAEKIRELTYGVTSPEFAEALEAHAALLKLMGRDQEAKRDEAMAAAVRGGGRSQGNKAK
jgi:tetratricopeptide (TPR) repeat protein